MKRFDIEALIMLIIIACIFIYIKPVSATDEVSTLKIRNEQDHKEVIIVSGNSFAWYRIQTEEANIEEIQTCLRGLDVLSSKLRQDADLYPFKRAINTLMLSLGELDKQVTLTIECTTAEHFTNMIRTKANMKKYDYSYCSGVDTRVISQWTLLVNDLSTAFQKIPEADYHYLELEFHTNRQMLVNLKEFVDKKLVASTKVAMQFQDDEQGFSWTDLFRAMF